MDEIIRAVILGIIQGLGEFLPISSSAHLIFVRYLFGFPEMSISFDVALHFGTLIAVMFIFWKDWLTYINGVYQKVIHKKSSFENNMFWYLVAATIPGAFIGFLLEEQIETVFRSSMVIIAFTLAIMGVLIYIGDKYAEKKYTKQTNFESLTFKQTFIIGLSQALAIIPGFSRSGTTILTARLMGITREASAKFTFLLSTPIIFGAAMLKADELIKGFNLELVVGIFTAAIVGIIAIKFLLSYIKNNGFAIFAYYRIIIAIIVLIKVFVG
ncbi:MAG: undecaprenyl-diphosphatase UppP [Clostridia bacterium]|nr:undecaprenyl-diphosphatase UppP [Clostridia bacterium]MDD4386697.1 undecaprenyl-diphosphatase UppP [Clostridia bacterium]